MTQEQVSFLLTILGAIGVWTGSVIGALLWISGQFQALRRDFYKEVRRIETKYDGLIAEYEGRIIRLELLVGGSSLSGLPLEKPLPGHLGGRR